MDVATAVDLPSALSPARARRGPLHRRRLALTSRTPPAVRQQARHGAAQLRGKRIGTRERGDLGQRFIAGQPPQGRDRSATGRSSGSTAARSPTATTRRTSTCCARARWTRCCRSRPTRACSRRRATRCCSTRGRSTAARAWTRSSSPRGGPSSTAPPSWPRSCAPTSAAFWFMRDLANMPYLQALEVRLRARSHNDDEQQVRMLNRVEKVEGWALPVHGGIVPERRRA